MRRGAASRGPSFVRRNPRLALTRILCRVAIDSRGSPVRARLTRRLPFILLLVLLGAGTALAGAISTVQVKSSRNASLNSSILVSSTGRTLYHLTSERGKKIACTSSCAASWPPLLATKGAKLTAGVGVTKGKLATIKRPDGKLQVTYAGFALYRSRATRSPVGQRPGHFEHVVRDQPSGESRQDPASRDTDPPDPPPPPPGDDYPTRSSNAHALVAVPRRYRRRRGGYSFAGTGR